MDWIIVLLIVVVAYFVGVFVQKKMQNRYLTTLDEADFRAGYRKAQLIDVREPDEFKKGHILGARNIPLTQLKLRKAEIRHDMPIYLYCSNGTRSARAAAMLKRLGYKNLYHLQGGFKKWNGRVKTN
ncbi:MAG: rhodanese-like domain-containing protein [Sporolactobacillus sp.]|jgi:rhodanese-related sulfurtransferase|nr:rhodanese-like domain-containing protein [Sporolactobacillus sp.]MCI1882478.1 rhodanese-like domain-containing protein [Sporolactobacillus sp.]